VGFKQTFVEYVRDERVAGVTKYPFKKMLIFALDGIFSFSTIPLKAVTQLGFLVTGFTFIYITYIVVNRLLGYGFPGYASIIISVLFLGGVQLLSIGILGQYIGRIFEEIKDRPLYIVERTINIE
jgi:dolichol-phosphate mannosyltransferase